MTELAIMDAQFLGTCLWQVTLFLGLGCLLARRLRNRPSLAHFVLLLGLLTAVLAPAVSWAIGSCGWGVLPPRNSAEILPQTVAEDSPAPESPPPTDPNRADGERLFSLGGSWPSAVAWAWLAMSGMLLFRLVLKYLAGLRVLARARPLVNERIHGSLTAAVAEVKDGALPIVFTAQNVRCPSIWCWSLHPALLLPPRFDRRGAHRA